ncbi:ABC transporter permease [Thermopolyspora sp. NPDC052614]|uniref:ABC transporter permease n=1 Tax=Thermopolyspora sp. NPDC052614 TaxID=3155682 RepID=UPI0034208CEF
MNRLVGRLGLARYSGLYVFAFFVLVHSLWLPNTFPTGTTLQSVASNQAITGVAALGLVCALSAGAFDLSIANVVGLSSTVAAALTVQAGLSPASAIAIVLGMGLAVGLVNGLLIVRFRIPSVVATLGMSSILMAFDDRITEGQFITPLPPSFTELTKGSLLGIPIPFLALIVVALLTWYLLEHTPLGRRMIATGAGADAARLAGTNTGRMTVAGLVISGVLGSLAGLMLVSTIGTAAPNSGPAYLLPLFAAVYLGSTQIKPGRFNIWGTIVALYVLATGVKGLQLAGGQYWVAELFNGAALIIAVGVAISAQERRRSLLGRLRPRRRAEPTAGPGDPDPGESRGPDATRREARDEYAGPRS